MKEDPLDRETQDHSPGDSAFDGPPTVKSGGGGFDEAPFVACDLTAAVDLALGGRHG